MTYYNNLKEDQKLQIIANACIFYHRKECYGDELVRIFERCSRIEQLYLEENAPQYNEEILERSLKNVVIDKFVAEGAGFKKCNKTQVSKQ